MNVTNAPIQFSVPVIAMIMRLFSLIEHLIDYSLLSDVTVSLKTMRASHLGGGFHVCSNSTAISAMSKVFLVFRIGSYLLFGGDNQGIKQYTVLFL